MQVHWAAWGRSGGLSAGRCRGLSASGTPASWVRLSILGAEDLEDRPSPKCCHKSFPVSLRTPQSQYHKTPANQARTKALTVAWASVSLVLVAGVVAMFADGLAGLEVHVYLFPSVLSMVSHTSFWTSCVRSPGSRPLTGRSYRRSSRRTWFS